MKILVITPWAPSVTRPRSLGLIRHLADQHEVLLVGAAWSEREAQELGNLPVQHFDVVSLKKFRAYLRCFWGLLRGRSLQQAYLDDPSMRAAIKRANSDFKPDLVFFNVIRTAQFVDEVSGVPLVIDLDEFRSAYYSLLSTTSKNPLWRVIAKLEAVRMKNAEQEVLEKFDRILVSSPTDVEGRSSKVRLVRSPHALKTTDVIRQVPEAANSIIFVGRQSYRANSEAITWFAEAVMPKVRRLIPGAHLTIVGDAPPRSVRALASECVTVTGRVNDVSKYYASAAVSVIPVRMATGVQMKLIESMTVGTPVVATSIVARGAGVDSRHCAIADSTEEWVGSVVQLLTDNAANLRTGQAARDWADREYSFAAIAGSLDAAVDGLHDATSASS